LPNSIGWGTGRSGDVECGCPTDRGLLRVNYQNLSSFIWAVADLLRGDYKQSD